MPRYNACSRCGYAEHESHGSTFCRVCGHRLKNCADTRDVVDEARAARYRQYLKSKAEFDGEQGAQGS